MSLFGRKPTPKEQMKRTERTLKKTQRDLERERHDLERQERKLEMEIKQAAKKGNRQVCTILAKQLVQLRKQKTKTYVVGSNVAGVGTQVKVMHSNMKMADAIGTTTKTMQGMNKVMDPVKTARTMQNFERQSARMEMSEEMINDTMDDILDDSGAEEEEDAIVSKVLDEIGIEISGKVAKAPRAHQGGLGQTSRTRNAEDDEIERQLAALKDL